MKHKLLTLAGHIAAFGVLAIAVQVALPTTASAADAQSQPQNQKPPTSTRPAQTGYKYVAQPGDSYTQLARKAAQTYGLQQKIEVSKAGIVFVETNMALEAGSPALQTGQTVEVSAASVKKWMDAAKLLSASDLAAWDFYVADVDFDTSKIGNA